MNGSATVPVNAVVVAGPLLRVSGAAALIPQATVASPDRVESLSDARSGRTSRLLDYVTLTKPRISSLALFTVAIGSLAASSGSPPLSVLIHAVVGTGVVAAGASAFNQLLERRTDARMRRTRNRPLPAGRLRPGEVVWFGAALLGTGFAYLSVTTNWLATGLALATAALYVLAYTPLKRISCLNTIVGAVPGALPPVIGWAAVEGAVPVQAWTIFLIIFLWQFPHFLAIAWMYRDDYARAGLKMLPGLDPFGRLTGQQMVVYSLALVPVSLAPTILGISGLVYFFGAVILGCAMLACAIRFRIGPSETRARTVLRASLVYLPLLFVLLVADLV